MTDIEILCVFLGFICGALLAIIVLLINMHEEQCAEMHQQYIDKLNEYEVLRYKYNNKNEAEL